MRELGRGGMGVVLEVRHPAIPRPLALKVLLGADYAPDPDEERRFAREMQLLAEVGHPGVVKVHDAGRTEKGQPWMVAELVPGQDLARLVRTGLPAPRRAAEIVRDLADALAHVHARGIVHRDLKPGNVILTPEGRPVLLDFGLARAEHAERLTRTGTVMGTPAYMAPEQAEGLAVGPTTDVYGLGGVLFFLLTGRPPFSGAGMSVLKKVLFEEPEWPQTSGEHAVPRDLLAICRQAMARDPAARYGGAAALRDDLARFLGGESVEARPPALPRGLGRAGLIAGALILLAVAGGLALVVEAVRGGPDEARPTGPRVQLDDPAEVASRQVRALLESSRPLGERRLALEEWLRRNSGHALAPEVKRAVRATAFEHSFWLYPGERALGRLVDGRLLLVEQRRLSLWSLPGEDLEEPTPLGSPREIEWSPLALGSAGRRLAILVDAGGEERLGRSVVLLGVAAGGDDAPRIVLSPELALPPDLGFGPDRIAFHEDGQGRTRLALGGPVPRAGGGLPTGAWALLELRQDVLTVVRRGACPERVETLAFSPSGGRLAVGSGALIKFEHQGPELERSMRSNHLEVFSAAEPDQPGPPPLLLAGRPQWMTFFGPEGPSQELLVGTTANELLRCPADLSATPELLRGQGVPDFRSHGGTVYAGALHGEVLVTAAQVDRVLSGELRRWSTREWTQVGETVDCRERQPEWLETDGRILLVVSRIRGAREKLRVELRLLPR